MTFAHVVVGVGAVLLVVGLVGLAIAVGRGIHDADVREGHRDDD